MRWFPLATNWLISVFEKRLHKTETSYDVVDSVKRSGVHISTINGSWNICQITRTLTIKKIKGPNFTNSTTFWL